MKKLSLILLFVAGAFLSKAQNNVADAQAIQMLKEFYIAYNSEWISTVNPYPLQKKLDSLRRKYCTIQLRNKLKKMDLDHDELINDQYTDIKHLKTLTVIKDPIKTNGYIVSYIAPTFDPTNKPVEEKIVIHVMVAKENGGFKIASVSE